MSKKFALIAILVLMGQGCVTATNVPAPSQDDAYERKSECFQAGKEYHEKHEARLLGGDSAVNPRYHYNQKLQTCIYAGGSVSLGRDAVVHEFILDLYTNKTLAEKFVVGEAVTNLGLSVEDYAQKEIEYFEE